MKVLEKRDKDKELIRHLKKEHERGVRVRTLQQLKEGVPEALYSKLIKGVLQ
jgi:hypothetical protein